MHLVPVIGLEVHVQLKTKSKMFCSCPNIAEGNPNSAICPVCLGHPGVLPVINEESLRKAVLASLSLNLKILPFSRFERKNYFYPDLPKGYQISQYKYPVAEEGYLDIEMSPKNIADRADFSGLCGVQGTKTRTRARIRIKRVHLEEDAAKLIHTTDDPRNPPQSAKSASLIDFNRGGTPLIEIVSEPDIASPLEARIYLQELRLILRYLDVSEADMEKGNLRCDANISLVQVSDSADDRTWYSRLNPKTELKNLNSFKAVERALEYEIRRQKQLWEEGNPPARESTRGWDDVKGISIEQRIKEQEKDYRYFPEPDLPPLELKFLEKEILPLIPELPQAKRKRFKEMYGLNVSDAKILTEDQDLAGFTEEAISELRAWLISLGEVEGTEEEVWEKGRGKLMKMLAGWLTTKLLGLLNTRGENIKEAKITPENFAEFITLVYEGKISGQAGLKILEKMLEKGSDPSHIIEEEQLGIIDDVSEIEKIVDQIISKNSKPVEDFKKGKEEAMKFLIGQAMRETKGKVSPTVVENMLRSKLAV